MCRSRANLKAESQTRCRKASCILCDGDATKDDICSLFSVASAHHGPLYRVAACRWCFFAYVQWWSWFIYHWFLLVDFVFTIYLCFIAFWVMARLWISSLPRCRFLQVAEHILQTAVIRSFHYAVLSFREKRLCCFDTLSVSHLFIYFILVVLLLQQIYMYLLFTASLNNHPISSWEYHILLFCCTWPLLFSCRIVHAFSYEENI